MATTITTGQTASTLPQKKGDPPNFGTVKSGRALSFDGAVDYLNTGYVASTEGITNTITVACWIKTTDVTIDDQWIWNFYEDNSKGWGLNISDENGLLKILEDINGDDNELYDATIVNDVWYRVVVVMDNLVQKLYVNGSLSGSGTTSAPDGLDSFTSTLFIGSRTGTTSSWAGSMSDFQIWNTAWSLTDVQNDYRHPEMLAHTLSGTSLVESNLKLWYPMTEGNPENPQTTIFDGSPKVLGDNPTAFSSLDFTSGDWTTTAGGAESFTSNSFTTTDANVHGMYANSSNTYTTVGKVYKCTLDATTTSTSGFRVWNAGGSGPKYLEHTSASNYSSSFYFTSTHQEFYITNLSAGTTTINSISIQEVQRGNHATSVFYGDELITVAKDKNFDASNNWDVTSANWSIDGNSLDYDGTGGGTAELDETYPAFVAGRTYQIKFNTSANNTKLTIKDGDGSNTLVSNATYSSGTKTVEFIAPATTDGLSFTAFIGCSAFAMDWVNVKEVGLSTTGHVEGQETIFQPAFVGQNRMIAFDGDTYVGLGTIDTFKNKSAISLSFWICPNSYNSHSKIAAFSQDEVIECIIQEFDVPMLKLYINNNGVDFNKTLPLNEWTHVVMTFTGKGGGTNDTRKLYLNGSLSVTNDDTGTQADTSDYSGRHAIIGGRNDTYEMDGFINEVCVWDKALSLSEVQELYNDGVALDATTHSASPSTGTDNLIGYWRNNKLTSTGTWEDLSQNDNHGTLSGGSTVISPEGTTSGRDINGFFLTHPNNNYLSLDGTAGCYVDIPDSSVLNFGTGDFTVEFWARYYKTGYMGLVSKGVGSVNGGWEVVVANGNGKIMCRIEDTDGSPSVSLTSSSAHNDGLWHHFVSVFDMSGNVTLYVDKVSDGTADITSVGDCDATHSLDIGRQTSSNNPFDGQIDDVRIYNKALTTAEIAKNYKHGKAKHKD